MTILKYMKVGECMKSLYINSRIDINNLSLFQTDHLPTYTTTATIIKVVRILRS